MLPFSPGNGTSTMYDPQAAFMASWYALYPPQNGIAPAYEYLRVNALPLAVNDTGYTVVSQQVGKPAYTTLTFPDAPYADTANVGAFIIDSIIAAH
jgi:hypothetical protein